MKAWLQRRVVRHGLFWALVLTLNFLMQLPAYFMVGTKLYVWGLFFNQLPASLLATYPLLYGVLPRLLRRQMPLFLVLLVGWLGAAVLLTGLTRAFYDLVVVPGLLGEKPIAAFRWETYLSLNYTWFVLLVTAGAASAIRVTNEWYQQRKLQELLQQRKLQAELQLLKAQLQPAFLFNTLRTLHELTARKAPESPVAVLHLSALLRYMLYESPLDAVPLADEAEMMRHYVALEQLRLGSRVEVSLSFSGTLGAHTIAPLLLLPFIENAFRHGTAAALDCPWISIDLVAKQNSIIFKVINSQAGVEAGWREGSGLRIIRQRLAHLYPNRHELKILTDADTFFIVLHLQFSSPSPLQGFQASPPATSNQKLATSN